MSYVPNQKMSARDAADYRHSQYGRVVCRHTGSIPPREVGYRSGLTEIELTRRLSELANRNLALLIIPSFWSRRL